MGWVGVVTLVATACYVLYRFPPRTWRDPVPPDSISGQVDKANNSQELDPERPSREEREYAKEEERKLDNNKAKEEEEEDADTPKASPAKVSLEVPELKLDHEADHKTENEDKPSASPVAKATNEPTIMPPSLPASPQPPPPPPQSAPSQSPQPPRNSLMPPPPPPPLRQRTPAQQQSQLLNPGRYPARAMNSSNTSGSSFLAPPPSAAASLRGPPPSSTGSSSLAPPRSSNSLAPPTTSSGLAPPSNGLKASKNAPRRAILEPGYSPLDWAALTSNPKNTLRGANLPPTLIRVTPSMLKTQNGRKGRDVWTSYQGKVYNITPYVPFHPGGKGELLRGAGKDSAKLFLEVHPWVNWDAILGECLVGILVAEEEQTEGNTLDAMD